MTMNKRKPKALPHDWKKLYIPASWVAAGVAAFLTSFFWINETFATKEAVVIAQIKADILLDKQMEGLLRQINELERKAKKSADDRQHLDYLRKELDHMRRIRTGK